MGNLFSRSKRAKVIVVGLDGSGKSTLVNAEHFRVGNVDFAVWDMSGESRYRNLWEYYYADCDAIVWVIDAADTVRMCVVKDELETTMAHESIRKRKPPVLFFANKSDLDDAASPADVATALALEDTLRDNCFSIAGCCALSGDGVRTGMEWLVAKLNDRLP